MMVYVTHVGWECVVLFAVSAGVCVAERESPRCV